MAGKSVNLGNWSPGPPATRYNASGKNREFYTFENAPGISAYATGGTIIDGGDGYIYHIFTGDGTFAVNRPSAAIDSVDYLIVAGGGAVTPGPAAASGGGGGGGFLFGNIGVSNAPGTYPISIGAGGPSVANSPTTTGTQRNGSPSTAFALTATGGGSGGNLTPGIDGRSGGSGGGGSFPTGTFGSGNTPATIPRQGYDGGTQSGASSGGGGAGGKGGTGAGPPSNLVGVGGTGRLDPNFPLDIIRRAMPAPISSDFNTALTNFGGFASGGCGTSPPGTVPAPLTRTNPLYSGFGGQGGGANAGGSGIVCIRYKKTAPYSRATGGTIEPSTHPEHPGVFRHIFTEPGTFAITDPTLQYVDYLAVAGGGGGGGLTTSFGGGGGAGGFVSSIHTSTTTPTSIPEAYPWNPGYSVRVGEQYSIGTGSYPIGIGTGGNTSTAGSNTTIGNPGGSQIIAAGGGAGATAPGIGGAGGSGGGGARLPSPASPTRPGGTATPTPLIQGNDGGSTPALSPIPGAAGGGGGGAVGSPVPAGAAGGVGWYSVLSPSAYGTPGPLTPNSLYRYFAGGGGGGATAPGIGADGGSGGGGAGGTPIGTPGTTNTGGGGGGGYGAAGGSGGSGIVIIQYPE